MQDITVARLHSTRVKDFSLPPLLNVMRESLSDDSQNIPCAALKRSEKWVISINLWSAILAAVDAQHDREVIQHGPAHGPQRGLQWRLGPEPILDREILKQPTSQLLLCKFERGSPVQSFISER